MSYLFVFVVGIMFSSLVKVLHSACAYKVAERDGKYYVIRDGDALERNSDITWTLKSAQYSYCSFEYIAQANERLKDYNAGHPSSLCKAKRAFYKWLQDDCK